MSGCGMPGMRCWRIIQFGGKGNKRMKKFLIVLDANRGQVSAIDNYKAAFPDWKVRAKYSEKKSLALSVLDVPWTGK